MLSTRAILEQLREPSSTCIWRLERDDWSDVAFAPAFALELNGLCLFFFFYFSLIFFCYMIAVLSHSRLHSWISVAQFY